MYHWFPDSVSLDYPTNTGGKGIIVTITTSFHIALCQVLYQYNFINPHYNPTKQALLLFLLDNVETRCREIK